jgi:hypothetical protein
LKLLKKHKNGQNETVGGQYNYAEHALAANPKSGFSTVLSGRFHSIWYDLPKVSPYVLPSEADAIARFN